MKITAISQVSIGSTGLLIVKPALQAGEGLEFIYRAARSARWLSEHRAISVTQGSRLSHPEAFNCIIESAAGEYGLKLVLTESTDWSGVPSHVRAEIQEGANHAA